MSVRQVKTVYGGTVLALSEDIARRPALVKLVDKDGRYRVDKRGDVVRMALANMLVDNPPRPVRAVLERFPDGTTQRRYVYADKSEAV